MVTVLVVLQIFSTLSTLAVAAWAIYIHRRHEVVIADLLDRLMCRDFQQYANLRPTISAGKKVVRKRVLTDDEMAELEASVKAETAGASIGGGLNG